MCHKEVLGHGDEIWALTVVGDRLVSGSIDRYHKIFQEPNVSSLAQEPGTAILSMIEEIMR